MLEKSSDDAMQTIQEGFAVVKMISSPYHLDRSWDLILEKLNDPGRNRFVWGLPEIIDRGKIYNRQTGEFIQRELSVERGLDKITLFTKKTSMTLLPPNGKIKLFEPKYGTPIGIMFDWRRCHRKDDKYVFSTNIKSDFKPWLHRKYDWKMSWDYQNVIKDALKNWTDFSNLQEKLRKHKFGTLQQNELLGGINFDAAIAILSPSDDFENRMNAISRKLAVLEKSKVDLPILIMNKSKGFINYTLDMQREDLLNNDSIMQCHPHLQMRIAQARQKTLYAIDIPFVSYHSLIKKLYSSHFLNADSVIFNSECNPFDQYETVFIEKIVKKRHTSYEWGSPSGSYYTTEYSCCYKEKYNILLYSLEHEYSKNILEAILKKWPQLFSITVTILFEMQEKVSNENYRVKWDKSKIDNAINLLVHLTIPAECDLSVLENRYKKIMLVDVILNQLKNIKLSSDLTNEMILYYYEKYSQHPVLSYNRSTVLTFFSDQNAEKFYPQSKIIFIEALQTMMMDMLGRKVDKQFMQTVLEHDLFNPLHNKRGISSFARDTLVNRLTEYSENKMVEEEDKYNFL